MIANTITNANTTMSAIMPSIFFSNSSFSIACFRIWRSSSSFCNLIYSGEGGSHRTWDSMKAMSSVFGGLLLSGLVVAVAWTCLCTQEYPL